jgi:patatin-related protein
MTSPATPIPGDEAAETVHGEGDQTIEGVKQLRLALVCYGGVSLAIYMHGVAKEIHKLVVASRAYDEDARSNPFDHDPRASTERVYWQALERRAKAQGVRTQVAVDIIAGTSAGGINGICLGKAVAENVSLDPLRDVWMDKGDINELVEMQWLRVLRPIALKALGWMSASAMLRLRGRQVSPPLSGDRMFNWIVDALEDMDDSRNEGLITGGTLMPEGLDLELFVPITDFYGYPHSVPTYDPALVTDRRHRHAMEFRRRRGENRFTRDYNAKLAFAARATSSFPGAFPPVDLAMIARNLHTDDWPGSATFAEEFANIYRLSDEDVAGKWFVDGGVLDNYPFRHAVESIRRKRASVEVDRRLLYIEPDPAAPPSQDRNPLPAPSLAKTIWGGISALPRQEPILDDLLEVRAFNQRVERVNAMVTESRAKIADLISSVLDDETLESLLERSYQEVNTSLREAAAKLSNYADAAYVNLKLYGVIEGFAALVSDRLKFPSTSNHSLFVEDALREWGRTRKLLDTGTDLTGEQREFLKTFDLDYFERRVRFVIKGVNLQYENLGEVAGRPERDDLDTAKDRFYGLIAPLMEGVDLSVEVMGELGRIFSYEDLSRYMREGDTPEASISSFLNDRGDYLDRLRETLAAELTARFADLGPELHRAFVDVTEGWDPAIRRELTIRYLGFPFWDVLVYPIRKVSDVGELNKVEVVRVSPLDAGVLGWGDKLKGDALGHFGAFFNRAWRENDYLWGRLDGAERLLKILLQEAPKPVHEQEFTALCHGAFASVLADERPQMRTPEVRDQLLGEIEQRMADPPPARQRG